MKHIEIPTGLLNDSIEVSEQIPNSKALTQEEICAKCHEQNAVKQSSAGFVFYENDYGERICHVCPISNLCKDLPEHHRRAVERVKRNSHMPKSCAEKSVQNFVGDLQWQKEMRTVVKRWCIQKEWKKNTPTNKEWIILCGQPGTGKTHLASACANWLLEQGFSVFYERWAEVMQQVRSHDTSLLEYCKRVQVLFLDDLYKGSNFTPMEMKATAELIDHRYANDLITIVTTEKDQNQLIEIDEATFSRIVEKANDSWYIVPKQEQHNYRFRKWSDGTNHSI